MSAYADTSALVSHVTPDANSKAARDVLFRLRTQVLITEWTELEFENAIQLKQFRGEAGEANIRQWRVDFRRGIERGFFVRTWPDFAAVLALAKELSALHTSATGARSFDVSTWPPR